MDIDFEASNLKCWEFCSVWRRRRNAKKCSLGAIKKFLERKEIFRFFLSFERKGEFRFLERYIWNIGKGGMRLILDLSRIFEKNLFLLSSLFQTSVTTLGIVPLKPFIPSFYELFSSG